MTPGLSSIKRLVQKAICLGDELIRATDRLILHLLEPTLQVLHLLPEHPQLFVFETVRPGHLVDQELAV